MSTGLSDIISLTITRETSSVDQASFSVPLILGENSTLTERYKLYSTDDLASFAAELTNGTSDPEYLAATSIAAQNPKVPTFAVGRHDSADASYTATLNAVVLESDAFYGICIADAGLHISRIVFDADFVASNTIDGKVNGDAWATVTYAASHAATATALAVAIQALTDVVTAVVDPLDATDRTILITGASSKSIRPSDVVVALGISQATATIDDGMEDRKSIASWAESNKKFFATQSTETEIVDSTVGADATSLAYVFKNDARERTALFYNIPAEFDDFPGAAFLGEHLPYVNDTSAGKRTTAFKTLGNVSATRLTVSQRTNAHDKNCNTYEPRGPRNIVFQGTTSESEWVDIIMFADWLEAKIIELEYYLLSNEPKVPYTDPGISQVVSEIQTALKMGQNNEGISPDNWDPITKLRTGGFVVNAPLASACSSSDKANRTLNNVTFTAYLSGAVHKVVIAGVLTY